jgi:uncharacterized membrane protein YgaE (UPF0421/DUF939 family)
MSWRRSGWSQRAGSKSLLARHPRIGLSVKAAAAAGLAWALVQPLGGLGDTYPYYAPLGAVIAVSTTVAGSVRESLEGLLAILSGATIAIGVVLVLGANVATLAIVVAVGTLVAGWRRLGSKASWVPLSALFVLIIGGADPIGYAGAYVVLTSLGAAVGIAANLALPPLPMTPTQAIVTALRETLADQLDDLAEGLLYESPLTAEDWEARRRRIGPLTSQMRTMVEHASDAQRANWRAGRWRDEAGRQYQQARALERLSFLVEDVTSLVVDHQRAERDRPALGATLRPFAAHAFEETAATLRSVEDSHADSARLRAANEAVSRLAVAVREERAAEGEDLFVAGTVIITIRRAIDSLIPDDPTASLPSRSARRGRSHATHAEG